MQKVLVANRGEIAFTTEDEEALDRSDRRDTLNRLLLPGPAADHRRFTTEYRDVSVLATQQFLYGLSAGEEVEVVLEPGVRLLIELEAITEPDDRGRRTVLIKLNGQVRPIETVDRCISNAVDRRPVSMGGRRICEAGGRNVSGTARYSSPELGRGLEVSSAMSSALPSVVELGRMLVTV